MGELANCARCGRVFVKGLRDICEHCKKEEDKDFETVYQYIRQKDHRMATLSEVVEATGVEEKLILKFIKEGRLRQSQFPNLGYPCQKCGTLIREGKLCGSCAKTLQKDINLHKEMEKREQERVARERQVTYYTMDRNNRRH